MAPQDWRHLAEFTPQTNALPAQLSQALRDLELPLEFLDALAPSLSGVVESGFLNAPQAKQLVRLLVTSDLSAGVQTSAWGFFLIEKRSKTGVINIEIYLYPDT